MLDRQRESPSISEVRGRRGAERLCRESGVEVGADPGAVRRHLRDIRPVAGLVSRQAAVQRVDAEGKEPAELLVEGVPCQAVTQEQVGIERLEMAPIEQNAVALRNRSREHRV